MAVEAKPARTSFSRQEIRSLSGRPSPPDEAVFNSFQQINRPKALDPKWAIFNASVFPTDEADYIISRAVYRQDVCEGIPDRNVLVVVKSYRDGSFERQPDFDLPIGERDGQVMNWEDTRIDRGTMGMTAVYKEESGYVAYPALVKVSANGHGIETQSEPVVLRQAVGKNVVPTDDGFIYRREGDSHVLKRGVIDTKGNLKEVGLVDFRNFSDIWWGSKKIGAVTRRIPIGSGLYMLPIHGVSESDEFDDIYSIGISTVDEDWHVLAVDPQPLITRNRYLGNLPRSEDLNPKKDVTYALDFWQRNNKVTFLVNVGDRITVFTDFWQTYLVNRSLRLLARAA